jgi:aminoglycoside phosphotransferase (APT) family kinase protein
VPTLFAQERSLLELIGPSLPEHLPRVIATDRARGWTLMETIPQETLRGAPAGRHEEALRLLARMQQTWAERVDELAAAGCADRRPETLAQGLREILARDEVRERLGDDGVQRLQAFGETIPARVEALRGCGVPETLMHGDFHHGNVAIDGERMVIFDWTDGCISHPFFDLATFLPEEPVERAALAQAYLDAWAPLVGGRQVERAWEIAEPLALVHHAVSYMRIIDAIDPADHWEFDSDPMFWLRWLRDVS